MQDSAGRNRDSGDDDRDGIRERPGDLKDDGQTREWRRDQGERPDDENGGKGETDRDPGRDSTDPDPSESGRGT